MVTEAQREFRNFELELRKEEAVQALCTLFKVSPRDLLAAVHAMHKRMDILEGAHERNDRLLKEISVLQGLLKEVRVSLEDRDSMISLLKGVLSGTVTRASISLGLEVKQPEPVKVAEPTKKRQRSPIKKLPIHVVGMTLSHLSVKEKLDKDIWRCACINCGKEGEYPRYRLQQLFSGTKSARGCRSCWTAFLKKSLQGRAEKYNEWLTAKNKKA